MAVFYLTCASADGSRSLGRAAPLPDRRTLRTAWKNNFHGEKNNFHDKKNNFPD
jgi:hypothetical protein